jgi:hypothetical protein
MVKLIVNSHLIDTPVYLQVNTYLARSTDSRPVLGGGITTRGARQGIKAKENCLSQTPETVGTSGSDCGRNQ